MNIRIESTHHKKPLGRLEGGRNNTDDTEDPVEKQRMRGCPPMRSLRPELWYWK